MAVAADAVEERTMVVPDTTVVPTAEEAPTGELEEAETAGTAVLEATTVRTEVEVAVLRTVEMVVVVSRLVVPAEVWVKVTGQIVVEE